MWGFVRALLTKAIDHVKALPVVKLLHREWTLRARYEQEVLLRQGITEEYSKLAAGRDVVLAQVRVLEAQVETIQKEHNSVVQDLRTQVSMLKQSNADLVEMDQYLQDCLKKRSPEVPVAAVPPDYVRELADDLEDEDLNGI